jgi:hypothetical protein
MANEDKPKKQFSTCLEDVPFAEEMQRMLGQRRVGSLCAEMMKRVMEKQELTKPMKEEDDVDEK